MVIGLQDYNDPIGFHPVTLVPQMTSDVGTLQLKLDRGEIKGIVELADQHPALDITVAVTGTGYNAGVTQDPVNAYQGHFVIPGVPNGSWEVSAVKSGYSRAVRAA